MLLDIGLVKVGILPISIRGRLERGEKEEIDEIVRLYGLEYLFPDYKRTTICCDPNLML